MYNMDDEARSNFYSNACQWNTVDFFFYTYTDDACMCCRIRWYQVRWQATRTHSSAHLSIRWKRSTRIIVKATPETNPVTQHQTSWSSTCTAKQDKMPPTDTHMVDPSIAAPNENLTKRLYNGLPCSDLDQIWHRWHSSSSMQQRKKSYLMWSIPFGCFSCTLNFHSAGTRSFLCLAGKSIHNSKIGWKQVKKRRDTNGRES